MIEPTLEAPPLKVGFKLGMALNKALKSIDPVDW